MLIREFLSKNEYKKLSWPIPEHTDFTKGNFSVWVWVKIILTPYVPKKTPKISQNPNLIVGNFFLLKEN